MSVMTPMLPTAEPGSAKILSACDETMYAPEAPTSPTVTTTGFFASFTYVAISSLAATVPPGESTRKTIALTLLSRSA